MKTVFTETKIWEVLKSAIIAIIVMLAAVLLSSLIIEIAGLPNSSVGIFEIVIKILSLLAGCLFGFKSGEKGWLKGLFTGALFAVFSFIAFGILSGSYAVNMKLLFNVLLALVVGMISGMFVNVTGK